MNKPILSILIITHNQRELLKRCLNSVFGQKLNVPFEVIVSDDRSEDGTAEYMIELQDQLINGKRQITNLTQLVYTRCNSNECDPKNVSERCGWNKLNAYQHARGVYFVNIDADDYLLHDDIYQLQIDMLEAHPECSMCMQDVWQVDDGASDDKGIRWPSFGRLKNEQILQPRQIISAFRSLNQCYMIRRHPEVDFAGLYGKHFNDIVITFHHLRYGPVVFLDRADYVWVQYKSSITKTLRGDDHEVEYGLLQLYHIRFVPQLAAACLEDGVQDLVHMLKFFAGKNYRWQLTERTQAAFSETPGRIYRVFSHPQSTLCDRMYLRYVRLVTLLYNRYKLSNWKYLYGLLIDRKSASKINWNR